MSSSNVSFNILFGQFQQSISNVLNANEAVIIAAQTSGSAAGVLIAFPFFRHSATSDSFILDTIPILLLFMGVAFIFLPNLVYKK